MCYDSLELLCSSLNFNLPSLPSLTFSFLFPDRYLGQVEPFILQLNENLPKIDLKRKIQIGLHKLKTEKLSGNAGFKQAIFH